MRQFGDLIKKLYRLYLDTDASLIEINPLITTKAGDIVALDGKINIDGSALFRQKKHRGIARQVAGRRGGTQSRGTRS